MIVFNHIGKTAGTTLKFIFRNTFGAHHCDSKYIKRRPFTEQDLAFARKIFPDIKCISGHPMECPTTHITSGDPFYITVLRAPINRTISHYQDDCLRRKCVLSLEEWLSNEGIRNEQVKRIAGEENADLAKQLLDKYPFVGLTEQFEESLQLLKVVSPYPLNIDYMNKVVAKDNTIKNDILNDPEKLEMIRQHNLLDIELYRYVKEALFPLRLEERKAEIAKVPKPRKRYTSELTFNYQKSIFINKFIYGYALKMKKLF